ncbi:hypothetical protein M752DRAFT_11734 [Aspergillus phoenicis ATCC 13157]|uniref:Uncharacterized protein n=1 Tax=Aspergillus phoenicis ATCC 13157 TaxID=1353007 RepID=A0A370Q166_ASPPH|nr:hypothetical protein M752DRAFT_11734 [Aspergillus phoenicis ATCC 13157]
MNRLEQLHGSAVASGSSSSSSSSSSSIRCTVSSMISPPTTMTSYHPTNPNPAPINSNRH